MNNNIAIAPESTVQANYSVTPEELAAFVAAVSERHYNGLKAAYPTCEHNWGTILASEGARVKFVRLVAGIWGCRKAFCFIDLSNGNILRCAGEKNPSGNIRSGDASNLWNGAFAICGGGLHVRYNN